MFHMPPKKYEPPQGYEISALNRHGEIVLMDLKTVRDVNYILDHVCRQFVDKIDLVDVRSRAVNIHIEYESIEYGSDHESGYYLLFETDLSSANRLYLENIRALKKAIRRLNIAYNLQSERVVIISCCCPWIKIATTAPTAH